MKSPLTKIALASALCAGVLAGCSSNATFTQFGGEAKAELKELEGTTESDFSLPYGNVAIDVELESGSVDIEVADIQVLSDDEGDSGDYVELDTIFEADGLASGDHKTFTDDDGNILVRITSDDKATGTITFSEG